MMRADYAKLAPKSIEAMFALEGSLNFDPTIKELVKLRVSQINGCVLCTDMHVKEAVIHGERPLRLHHLAVWRESKLFSDKERAALEWAEKLTTLPSTHVTDADFAAVRAYFSEQETVNLTYVITTINAWNRLGVAFALEAGSYDKEMGLDKTGL